MNEFNTTLFPWPTDHYIDGIHDISTKQESVTWWKHLIAGGVAGAISRTCTAPIDRIKLYLQIQTQKTRVVESLKYLIKEGGVLSMWRANGINVLKMTPETAIKFAIYEYSKRFLRGDEPRHMTLWERFIAGALAGNVSQTVIYPMDVLKTRFSLAKTGQYSGIIDAARDIFVREGLRSFYRGYSAFVIGIMLYCGIDLSIYETIKKEYLIHAPANNTVNPILILSCGTLSTSVGQVSTYPLALVGTRLQATAILREKAVIRKTFLENNIIRLMWIIFQKEGITGMYRGLIPNFAKSIPSVCITYIVYEYIINNLGESMT